MRDIRLRRDEAPRQQVGVLPIRGAAGQVGPQGPQGAQGVEGPQGAQGPSGSQGPQGSKGDSVKGDKGDQGPKGDPGLAILDPLVITQTAVVAITTGPRVVELPYPQAAVGETYLILPITVPAGYLVQNSGWCDNAGKIKVVVTAPTLAIGASYSITCKVRKVL